MDRGQEKRVGRVLHVVPATPDGGGCAMIFAKRQIASLERIGIEVKTFFLTSRTSVRSLLRERRELKDAVRSYQPDLIHAHYGTMTALLCASVSSSRPLIVTYRGSDLNPSARISRFRGGAGRLLSQLAALRATRIVCVSERLKRRLWWGKHKVSVIPSGIDLQLFAPLVRDEARARLGWPVSERVVLFNAGAAPQVKRLDLAQAATAVAEELSGELRLEIVNGDVAPSEMPLYLSAADCLIFTSDREGSPNIIKEALACNLPIVSVDVGDTVKRLRGVEPTRIVGRDAHALGEAIVELLRLGRRSDGRERVSDISEESVAVKLRSVYETACCRRPNSGLISLESGGHTAGGN